VSLGVGVFGAVLQPPAPAHASYAMYAAAQDTYLERKSSGYVPVATNDKATLTAIQDTIAKKRGVAYEKRKKAPQYCAGQTASVTPMLENVRL
jgi:hypothetical protein